MTYPRPISEIEAELHRISDEINANPGYSQSAKAKAIMAGAAYAGKAFQGNDPVSFLNQVADARKGDVQANEFIKGVLGTSSATGTAIIPNNFVASLVDAMAAQNIYRQIFTVQNGVSGAGVDIPYEVDAITAALVQGAYGSNKDIRDWGFARATATLYTIAQIADIGNQLLRQSNGAAERSARNRLAKSIAKTEAQWVTNGTGIGQPLGIFQAFLAYLEPGRVQDRAQLRASSGDHRTCHRSPRGPRFRQGQHGLRHGYGGLLGSCHGRSRHLVCRWLGSRSGRRRRRLSAHHVGMGRPALLRPELACRTGRHRTGHRPVRDRDLHRSGIPDRRLVRSG